jgi:hypothetical protein
MFACARKGDGRCIRTNTARGRSDTLFSRAGRSTRGRRTAMIYAATWWMELAHQAELKKTELPNSNSKYSMRKSSALSRNLLAQSDVQSAAEDHQPSFRFPGRYSAPLRSSPPRAEAFLFGAILRPHGRPVGEHAYGGARSSKLIRTSRARLGKFQRNRRAAPRV